MPKHNTFPIIATILTIASISILCSLGTWQLQRLSWKENIISKLNQAYQNQEDIQNLDFTQDYTFGQISGKLLTDKALLIKPRTREGKVGSHLLIPLETPSNTILINLGWTDQKIENITLPKNTKATITGLARRPYWNSFTPNNTPETNEWYKANIQEIASIKKLRNPIGYILYAEKIKGAAFHNFPNNKRWSPPNNHAQYAAFWFSMAVVLLVIYKLRFFKKSSS